MACFCKGCVSRFTYASNAQGVDLPAKGADALCEISKDDSFEGVVCCFVTMLCIFDFFLQSAVQAGFVAGIEASLLQ